MSEATMPPAITLRAAVPADALTLSAVAIQVFLETYAPDGVRPDLAREAFAECGPEVFAQRLAAGTMGYRLAEAGTHLLGFAEHRLGPTPAPAGGATGIELVRLYVRRSAQGRGLGARLLQEAERAARATGATHLWLTAWERNTRALGFYRAQGMVDAGGTDYVFEGRAYPNRVFVKNVAAGPPP